MTEKRFKRYLLDGGFWFDEYVKPVWSITDTQNKDNPIGFIEFKDEYKDLCDDVVNELNKLHEENQLLKSENNMLRTTIGRNEAYINRLENKGV